MSLKWHRCTSVKQDINLVKHDGHTGMVAFVRRRTRESDEDWPSPYKWRAFALHALNPEFDVEEINLYFRTQKEAKAWLVAIVQLEDKTRD